MTSKEAYYAWCASQPALPLFMQGWWMDAVCVGKEWTTVTLPSGTMMPLLLRRKAGMRYVLMPQETQIGGYFGGADSPDSLDDAVCSLRLAYYWQKYPLETTPLLEGAFGEALRQKGYHLQKMVTYRIEDLSDEAALVAHFSENKRRQLKKAAGLTLDTSLGEADFFRYHTDCLRRQGKQIVYGEAFWHSLYSACRAHDAGQILALRTPEGQLAAAAFLVYDARTTYYLIPTYDPALGHTGAGARLVLESLRFAAQHSRAFDFEGSMIPGVAQHYRQFGSTPVTYYAVERCFNPLFRILLWGNSLRDKVRRQA